MSLTRKTLVTVLTVLALVTAGVVVRDRAEARPWIIDTKPTVDQPTSSGDPDVYSHSRIVPTDTHQQVIARPVASPNLQKALAPTVRWLGWIWLNRNMGMGL